VAEITATVTGLDELKLRFGQMTPRIKESLRTAIAVLQLSVTAKIQGLISGDLLRNRTGNLRSGIHPTPIETTETSVTGGVATGGQIYARINELGGVIRPQNAQFLTVPLAAVLTANGVARFSAREIIESPGQGGYIGTFFRNNVLFGKRGGADIEPLFALKSSVTITGKHYMQQGLESLHGEIQDRLTASVMGVVKGES